MATTRAASQAREAQRRILRSKNRFWRPDQLHLPASTAQHLLARLVHDGELRRIRKGLYWRGVMTPLGKMAPPPTKALLSALLPTKGIGPSGLSAANALRLTTQVPRRAEFAVPCRAPASPVDTLRLVSRPGRTGRVDSNLSEAEVAALEVLDSWDRVIEVTPKEAYARFVELLDSGVLRPERLTKASRTESASTRARLQVILDGAGRHDLAEKVPAADPRSRRSALALLGTR